MAWDSALVKTQLRSTIQYLGQLQARKDADAAITRKDIATLLDQGDVTLARSKAQKLIQDDTLADLLEVLEQQVGILLDRFAELEQQSPPSPALVEASSSIIFTASRIQLRDLNIISDMITNRLGDEVASSARDNRNNHVSPGVLRATSRPTPSSHHLDTYLERIAKSHGVSWNAGPRRQDLANPISEVLNPTTNPSIDITQLRRLCSQGIPDEPVWLRPRIWKLLMNVIPTDRSIWQRENTKQRDAYYDLVRRLLKPFTEFPPPVSPISGPDETLLEVYKHLTRIPLDLLSQLDSEPEELDSCPLHPNSPNGVRISFANCLDTRLQLLLRLDKNDQQNTTTTFTPEIRLEANVDPTPSISLTEPRTSLDSSDAPTTLLSSRTFGLGSASQRHVSALLRLLYIHASINPGNLSPYVPSLVIPLYTALMQEVEQEDLAHAEADSFWLFEAFVAEFAELEDDESLQPWMIRFGEQLERQDSELSEWMNVLGLHPSSPHFSRRWLSSMLTHTLPLPAVFPVWDIILSRPGRERGKHPRLDSLIEICAAMAIAAKPLIIKQRKAPGLWDRDPLGLPAQPGEGFLESLTILQSYPVDTLGGIDTILQLMTDLNHGQSPFSANGAGKKDQMGLGARIRVTMWKGFTNQVDSPDRSDDEDTSSDSTEEAEEDVDDGNETETPGHIPQSNSLTSRIANTVWRGITNQSSMDAPVSPVFAASPAASQPATPSAESKDILSSPGPAKDNANSAPANLWAYTEKLKDSDTMATLTKLSTNWRAKAMLTPWSRPKEPASAPVAPPQETRSALTSPVQKSADPDLKRSSLPIYDHTGTPYTPPPRPTFFRNPRDSFIPSAAASMLFSSTETSQREDSPPIETSGGLLEKTRNLQSSLRSLTRTPSPMPPPAAPKSGPRPLMLSSSSLITSTSSGRSRVLPPSNDSAGSAGEDWADVMKLHKSQFHRDSMSSVSSLSPSDAIHRKSTRSEYDSDSNASKIVPLNRRSVSPMAPASKLYHSRPPSTTSTISSDQAIPETPAKEDASGYQDTIGVVSPKEDEITPNGNSDMPILPAQASLTRKSYRRKPEPSLSRPGDASDSSTGDIPSRASRLRSKRYPPRLSNLQIDNTAQFETGKQSTSPSSLAVPWPSEDLDVAITPKASSFDSNPLPASPSRSPKMKEERPRKVSNNTRHRKVSSSNRESARRSRADSIAEDGDDEGYDDLLSAYESEESSSLT